MRVLTALVCFTFSEAKVNYHESNAVYIKTMQGLGQLLLHVKPFQVIWSVFKLEKSKRGTPCDTPMQSKKDIVKVSLTFRPADTVANKSRRRKRWRLGLTRAGAAGE